MINYLKNLFLGRCLLSHDELLGLIDQGVITADKSQVKGTTIDLTLADTIRVEAKGPMLRVVKLFEGDSIDTIEVKIEGHHVLMPDAVALGATNEVFTMPPHLSAEFSLKSTLGRNFLGHQLAGWIDPTFIGTLTLELKNDTQFHKLAIAPGMSIGQVKFFRHRKVPPAKSYKANGQYMFQDKVQAAKVLS